MNKIVIKSIVSLAAFLLFFSSAGLSQYYDIGSEKSSVKWNRMRSKNFEIIYPAKNLEGKEGAFAIMAKDYLKKMESLYGIYSDSVKYSYGLPKRFPLVLHPFSVESNGITVWGPRQIDFFPTQPVDVISSEPWISSLAGHEGRHVWQIAHMNRGFFKALYWLFGDQATGALSGIYPSSWMLEGDAVVAETQMSSGGRGRSGFFLQNTLKAIVPENSKASGEYFYGKNRSWDRWRLGSVKAYSPSYYDVGYMINAGARYHSGDADVAHKILKEEPLHFFNPNVVASTFRKFTGKTHRQFVKDSLLQEFLRLNTNTAVEGMLSSIQAEASALGKNISEPLSIDPLDRTGVKQGYYTEYKYITAIGKDTLAAIVRGNGTPGYLVMLTRSEDGKMWKEDVIRPYNCDINPPAVYNNGKLWWSEDDTDRRWGQHSTFFIYNVDTRTGTVDEYPGSEGEQMPQFMEFDGESVLYSVKYSGGETDSGNYGLTSLLHCIDAEATGNYPQFEYNGQITSYAFGKHDAARQKGEVFFTVLDDRGMSIVAAQYAVKDGEAAVSYREILSPSFHIVKMLKFHNGELYFLSDKYGSPMLCKVNPETKEQTIASVSSGISYYTIDSEDNLYVAKAVGDKGVFPFRESLVSIPATEDMEFNYPMAEELSRQYNEKYGSVAESYAAKTDSEDFRESAYSKGANLFRLHSWAPVYAEFSGETSGDFESFYEEILPGVTLYSQNTLGTMRAQAGYAYQRESDGYLGIRKNLHSAHAAFSWSGWYPVLEGELHFNDRIMLKKDRYSLRTSLAAYIPLTWVGDGWNNGKTYGVSWTYRNDLVALEPSSELLGYKVSQIGRHQMNLSFSKYRMQSIAKSQVFPRWGIGARFAASLNPAGGKNFGSQYSAYLYGYLPGLTFNQGLRLSAAFQRQVVEGKRYWLDNHIDAPRGFTEDIFGRNIFKATADYAVPIYAGDISIGLLAYLQQLQIIPFVDYSRVDFHRLTGGAMGFYTGSRYVWEDRYSYGADVMLKGHVLRIGFPIYVGVRYARCNKPCDFGNSTPASYAGSGSKNFCSLLLGITLY